MLNIKNNCALKTMEKQFKTYEIVFDYEHDGQRLVNVHVQVAQCLEDARRYFIETIPYVEIYEGKYRGLRVYNGKPTKEVNSA